MRENLNPRPQPASILNGTYLSKVQVGKENILFKSHPLHFCMLRSLVSSGEVLRRLVKAVEQCKYVAGFGLDGLAEGKLER
jgi:hypothetical protein